MAASFRIGVDENGLGARLGPLIVTGVLARITPEGERVFSRKLPRALRAVIGDSKSHVSHADVSLGQAWARALGGARHPSPDALFFESLSLEGRAALRAPCPTRAEPQCWSAEGEAFDDEAELERQVLAARKKLADRGVELVSVKSSVLCCDRLNRARAEGKNRFVADLHAMERVALALREEAGDDVLAVCGKVGGMHDYSRFFGPLSSRLHVVLESGRAKSSYRFPGFGQLSFVRDADALDPLVMLASLVGKWVRELLMARVARFYLGAGPAERFPSGYSDPVTGRFVSQTALVRRERGVPDGCFEREGREHE